METAAQSSKVDLKASNVRLNNAFRQLQHVIGEKLQARESSQPIDEQKLDVVTQENERLKKEIQLLSAEYASLKQASMDAFTHLNHSINQLESLIVHNEKNVC